MVAEHLDRTEWGANMDRCQGRHGMLGVGHARPRARVQQEVSGFLSLRDRVGRVVSAPRQGRGALSLERELLHVGHYGRTHGMPWRLDVEIKEYHGREWGRDGSMMYWTQRTRLMPEARSETRLRLDACLMFGGHVGCRKIARISQS